MAYDGAAVIQVGAARRLAETIAAQTLAPSPAVLEIGCGTGLLTEALRARLSPGPMLVTDLAPAMVARCRARCGGATDLRFAVMDGERPAAAPGFDLIASSLAAQWFVDLPTALATLSGLLRSGGLLAVSTLARGTFREWDAAHAGLGHAASTPCYPSLAELAALRFEGCTTRVTGYDLVEDHASGPGFLRSLRAIGAQTGRREGASLSAGALRGVLRRFEAGGARVTYATATCLIRKGPDFT